ncbi:MAG: tetratricopeptide repeat protein [Thermoanaerobaculia bacterium]
MRSTSFLPFLPLFALLHLDPALAQDAPPGTVTSEDLLDEPEVPAPAADPPPAESGAGMERSAEPADALGLREREAEQAFMDGDLPRALALYRELAALAPAPPEGTRLRVTAAWLQYQLANPEAASRELTAALVDDPAFEPRSGIYSPEFMALFLNAQRDAAEERRLLASQRLKQGIAALTAGDTAGARRNIEASLQLAPDSLRAVFALAQVDLAEKSVDAALAGFERVLALERGAPERLPRALKAQALNNVGFIYFGRGQFEDSLHALEEASKLDTRDPRIWFNLGLARQQLGLAGPGLDALRTAHELDRQDAEIALELGRAFSAAQRFIDAVAVLLEATQAHPDSAVLWLEFALAQRGLGNLEGMATSLGKAIELDPANSQGAGFRAAMELAQSSLAGKNYGRAITGAEAAARLRPEDGSAWALLGLAQQASGRLPEAALSLEKAAAVEPQRADIAHNLGTVYLAQRRYPEAETSFRRAVAIDPAATESAAAIVRLEAQRAGAANSKDNGKRGQTQKPATSRPVPAKRPQLGARLQAVDYPPLGIRGLLVEEVTPGGLAAGAGLLVDDLVLRAGGRPLVQPTALQAMIDSSPGISIQLSVLRAGKPVEIILHP